MIFGEPAELEVEELGAQLLEALRKAHAGTVGVADDQAAFLHELLELVLIRRSEVEGLLAGDVEDGGVVKLADVGLEVDDLPVQPLFHFFADMAREIGDVTRAFVPRWPLPLSPRKSTA